MNGMRMPVASAGSNHAGANPTCTAHVSCAARVGAVVKRTAPSASRRTAENLEGRRVALGLLLLRPLDRGPLKGRSALPFPLSTVIARCIVTVAVNAGLRRVPLGG